MSEELISTVYDHYKETCSLTSEAIKRRDKMMILVIFMLGFFAFQGIFPGISSVMLKDYLDFSFGLTSAIDFSVIGNIVWFLLLIFVLRYFQIAVFIERQYPYMHKLEDVINKKFGVEVITREGKAYLHNYPLFSDWMWVLYTIIFPLLLLASTTAKIAFELKVLFAGKWCVGLIFDVVIFLLLAVSVILYLVMLHKKRKDK